MHCHCGTNNRVPRWTFTDPCKPEVRPGAREESASPAWLAAPAMNARDTTKVYIWRLDTGCGPTLYDRFKCVLRQTDFRWFIVIFSLPVNMTLKTAVNMYNGSFLLSLIIWKSDYLELLLSVFWNRIVFSTSFLKRSIRYTWLKRFSVIFYIIKA